MGYLFIYLLGVLTAVGTKKDHANGTDYKSANDTHSFPIPLPVVNVPPSPTDEERAKAKKENARRNIKFWGEICGVAILTVYAGFTVLTWWQVKKSADAAKESADTAAKYLILQERPWIKIKHRIVQPLTFDVPGHIGPVATMVIEDTLENVGPTVALNVLSWEDVIPIDPDHSTRTARARQSQYCDTNRHPDPNGMTGNYLFPHDPYVQLSQIGRQWMLSIRRQQKAPFVVRSDLWLLDVSSTDRPSNQLPALPIRRDSCITWGIPAIAENPSI